MKFLTHIQSFSDVVTNSSSEVFLMNESDALHYENLPNTNGCVWINELTEEYILDNYWNVWEMICDHLDLDKNEISRFNRDTWYGYWDTPSEEDFKTFYDLHKDLINSELSGMYIVEIEDHFEDCCEVLDSARSNALWSESRH